MAHASRGITIFDLATPPDSTTSPHQQIPKTPTQPRLMHVRILSHTFLWMIPARPRAEPQAWSHVWKGVGCDVGTRGTWRRNTETYRKDENGRYGRGTGLLNEYTDSTRKGGGDLKRPDCQARRQRYVRERPSCGSWCLACLG